MHEKLKMRVNLGCSTGDDGSSIPHVSENQCICGRMDHGTFYMLYLELTNSSEFIGASGETKYRYEFNLFLQNFDGAITMGFDEEQDCRLKKSERIVADDSDEFLFDYQFKIRVQPFNSTNTVKQLEWVTDEPLTGKIFDVDIAVVAPPNMIYKKENLENSEYIDPLVWTRDGEDFLRVHYRPQHEPSGIAKLQQDFGEDIVNLLSVHDSKANTNFLDKLKEINERGYGRPKTPVCYPRRFKTN